MPGSMPVTTPVADTVPVAVLLLVQVPPDTEPDSALVRPTHTLRLPVIEAAAGRAFTVIGWMAVADPHTLDTV